MIAPEASTSVVDSDLQAALRVEWCKAQERAKRYEEEVGLTVEEMRHTLATFEWNAKEWDAFAISPPLEADDTTTVAGIAAIAHERSHPAGNAQRLPQRPAPFPQTAFAQYLMVRKLRLLPAPPAHVEQQ